jgi:hypothetical protein
VFAAGGFYFTLLNFNNITRSDPRNLFLLSLVPTGVCFDAIVKIAVAELVELSKGKSVLQKGSADNVLLQD